MPTPQAPTGWAVEQDRTRSRARLGATFYPFSSQGSPPERQMPAVEHRLRVIVPDVGVLVFQDLGYKPPPGSYRVRTESSRDPVPVQSLPLSGRGSRQSCSFASKLRP